MNAELVVDVAPKLNPFVLGFSEVELKAENGFAGFEAVEEVVVVVAPKPVLEAPKPVF